MTAKPQSSESGARIAFLEKVFLKPLRQDTKLRGVELFNLGLVRDLAAMGHSLFIPAHRTWHPLLSGAEASSVAPLPVVNFGPPILTSIGAAFALIRAARRQKPFSSLIVANDADGLVPSIRLMRRAGAFRKFVLIAHKLPSRRFAAAVSDIPGAVVCVCGAIADAFRQNGVVADVKVDYGVVNADAFHPAQETRPADGTPLRVCLLGDMTSKWKGADTAIAAMGLLPESHRGRIELHIKAFRDDRAFPAGTGIIAHPWSGAGDVPEFLRSMDVLLAASRNRESDGRIMETFSQTIVQGMLTGLPVVHTSIPPFVEKFDAGGGIAADTPEEIAAALVRLADDPALRARLGREARATALARYVWDTSRFCRRFLGEGSEWPTETMAAEFKGKGVEEDGNAHA